MFFEEGGELHGTIAAPSLSRALSAPAAVTKHTGYDVMHLYDL